MSAGESSQPARSPLSRIFVSPEEPRLRAGWRLLLHLVLIVGLLVPMGVVLVVLAAVSSGLVFTEVTQIDLTSGSMQLLSALMVVAAVTLATWIARRLFDRRTFLSLGLHVDQHALPDLVFGIVLGGLLMGAIFAFETAMGWLHFEGWAWQTLSRMQVFGGLLGAGVLYVAVGYQEELFSRGYQLQNLRDGLNLPLAVLVSSVIFGLLHLGNPSASWNAILGIVWAGVFLAYGWIRTRRLWLPIGVHIGWNFFQGTIFGFPVSGTGGFHLIQHTVEGPLLITGGAFGPEGGLVGWVAILVGMALISLYTRGRSLPPEEVPVAPPEAAQPQEAA